ncbi:uncharacterized protein A4U43_C10F8500 [Asparagus officinalis]|uniref:Uncharacterized protein n=1 Tax=Asparagus officinalis TaxID=4686 RepID=A0A5P1E4Q6_ASPOF|nr:uncharacterized protein LOC109825877 [Asparagus officinalis]ONK56425.1 uncharacterized protein A4U43_C10F8500 [Asparagus officinalis]
MYPKLSALHSSLALLLISYSMDYKLRERRIWDCDSALYDSFELISFKRQLDSALIASSRCLSLPRLSDPDLNQISQAPKKEKKRSKVGRLIRSLFRLSGKNSDRVLNVEDSKSTNCDGVNLPTIPEEYSAAGVDLLEFDLSSAVRKTISERFPRNAERW